MGRRTPETGNAGQSIPIPANVAETLAEATLENTDELRERGYENLARAARDAALLTLQITATAEGGEFVSLDADTLGKIAAHRRRGMARQYAATARQFLEQYGHWNSRKDVTTF